MLRFAEADTLPLDFGNFAETVARYVQEVTKLAETTRNDIAERNRMLSEGTYRAVYDPTQTYVLPKEEALPAALRVEGLSHSFGPRQADGAAIARLADGPKSRPGEAREENAFRGPFTSDELEQSRQDPPGQQIERITGPPVRGRCDLPRLRASRCARGAPGTARPRPTSSRGPGTRAPCPSP